MTLHAAFALCCLAAAQALAEPADPLQGIAVPAGDQSPETQLAAQATLRLLAGIGGEDGARPRTRVTPELQYILHGDLFGDGRCYALVDIAGRVGGYRDRREIGAGLAEWSRGQWRVIDLYNIEPVWRPDGYQKKAGDEADDYYLKAPVQPFWIKYLEGSPRPIVVIAGNKTRKFDDRYIFSFDKSKRRLIPEAYSEFEPDFIGQWLCINAAQEVEGYDSARYLHWSKGHLMEQAGWAEHDGEMEHMSRVFPNEQDFYLQMLENVSDRTHGYIISKEGKQCAWTKFTWPEKAISKTAGYNDSLTPVTQPELGYLFEKLTGVPKKVFWKSERDDEDIRSPEGIAEIDAWQTRGVFLALPGAK